MDKSDLNKIKEKADDEDKARRFKPVVLFQGPYQLKAGKTEAISPLLIINKGRQTLFSLYASARHPKKEELLP